ncbi:hypothetical protein M9H77_36198 [Catharanthus roseus]|uniref:Uncharacterized protein n=1 Tax=Catharanthus roseus TaxID=4058 RepID=A0ACB9ZRI2_CATRO|nr:hypothetical protein M9H77_36198 [Catharanthus roseus]
MNTTYKTNKYNLPLLEAVGMSPTGKNFTVATAFMCNEQATTYQWNVGGDGNCGFRIVSNFLFGDENHWVEIRRRMCFDLHHHMNVYVQLFGLVERITELIRQTNWEEGSCWNTCHWIHTGIAAFHTATLARWMPFASTTGAMEISSKCTS